MGFVSGPSMPARVIRVGPHEGSHPVAMRAAVSVAAPLLVLWAIGHLEWSIYAALGAFTSLYGRNHVGLSRFRMQLTVAVVLTAAVALGVTVGMSPSRGWLAIPVANLAAGLASLLSDAQGWHPPGALFVIFALAACGSIPSEPVDVVIGTVVAGSSAAVAIVVGGAGGMWRSRLRRTQGLRNWTAGLSFVDVAPRHALRCMASCGLAGVVATASGIGHPYWAMVSAVVPLTPREFSDQVVRGTQRIIGTACGLGLAGLLLSLDLTGLALIGAVVALQATAQLWVGRNYAIALVAVTALALLMVHSASPLPVSQLVVDRGVETLIGVVIGVGVGWATRARHRPVATTV